MAIFLYVVLAFLLLILVIPYLMPLGKDHTGIPLDALVRDNGRFLDVGGVWMYVEEQTTESAAENRAIWAEIPHMRALKSRGKTVLNRFCLSANDAMRHENLDFLCLSYRYSG